MQLWLVVAWQPCIAMMCAQHSLRRKFNLPPPWAYLDDETEEVEEDEYGHNTMEVTPTVIMNWGTGGSGRSQGDGLGSRAGSARRPALDSMASGGSSSISAAGEVDPLTAGRVDNAVQDLSITARGINATLDSLEESMSGQVG